MAGIGASSIGSLAGCTDMIGGRREDSDGGDGPNDRDDGRDTDTDPLRIGITFDPESPLSLWISSWATYDWMRTLVFDKLVEPNPMVEKPIPGLAEETAQVDGTTWRVTVRDGIEWHDGEPFTAEDVEFCYRYYRDGPHTRFTHHLDSFPHITDIEQEDDETVRFETEYPTATLRDITFADLPVFSKHVWEDVEEPREYTELPVGTGPYELVEYQQGERLRFVANEDYWAGEPIVNEIVTPIIPDPSTTFTALKTGEIDSTVRSVPPETLDELRPDSDIEVVNATQLSAVELRFNYEKEFFADPGFRWALSRSVDADRITDIVMLGEAISGSEGRPHPRSPWTAPDLEMPHRPEAAREQLDQMEYIDRDGDGVRESPGGEPVSFDIEVASNEPQYIRAAQLLEDQFAEVGFDANLWTRDAGSVGDEGYDMYITEMNYHLSADPDMFLLMVDRINDAGPGVLDASGAPYPEFEELKEQYFASETREEQLEASHNVERLHMSQPAYLPLWFPLDNQAYRPDAHDRWAETPAFGIHHKWSFLNEEAREGAVTERFY